MNSGIESDNIQTENIHEFYTDGGGNTGNGTWAFINTKCPSTVIIGYEPDTTNNRMELTAVIEAIKSAPAGSIVHIFTDSGYVQNGYTKWVRNKWRLKQPFKNQDLWEQMLILGILYDIRFTLIPGHNGIEFNEIVDAACTWTLRNMDSGIITNTQTINLPKGIGEKKLICPQVTRIGRNV